MNTLCTRFRWIRNNPPGFPEDATGATEEEPRQTARASRGRCKPGWECGLGSRSLPVVFLILLLATAPAWADDTVNRVRPHAATYEAHAFGSTLTSVNTLAYEEDGNVRMTLDARVSGLLRLMGSFEFSRNSLFRPGNPDPELLATYSREITPRRERESESSIDETGNLARGHLNGNPFEIEVPPGVQDFLSMLHLTMTALPAGQLDDERSVHVIERDRVRQYSMETHGSERIRTPLGDFDAIQVVRQDAGKAAVKGWFAPELDHLPVRLEYEAGGTLLRLQITRIDWHEPPKLNAAAR